jgi:hypothetical protein
MTLLALFSFIGARAQQTLTVCDGTDNNRFVPFYGSYADTQGAASEFVIPSHLLGEMAGGTITAMTFYLQQPAAEAWTGTHQVYIGEVDATTLTGITGPGSFTVVKTASFDATGAELTVVFDEPYTYEGGNLLIGTYVSVAGNYKNAYFYGVSQTENTGWYRGGSTFGGAQFIPKTTFTYEPSTGLTCAMPSTFVVTDITTSGASFVWKLTEAGSYRFEYKKASDTEWTPVIIDGQGGAGNESYIYTLSGLEPETDYYARVRAICGEGSESNYKSLNFTTPVSCPDGKVCIGTGTATNTIFPANNNYKYNLTEQIYTADEIGEAGAILSLDFFKASTTEMVKDLDIYIVSTDKTAFESNTDWITVTASDLVYRGTVTFADNDWTTIELDEPFVYDGHSNICIVVDDNTGSYKNGTPFRVFDASGYQSIWYHSNGTNLAPTGTINATGTGYSKKNRIRLGFGEPPACPKPTGLAASNITAHTATLTWTAPATEKPVTGYVYQYKKASDTEWSTGASVTTTSVALSGLNGQTTYDFQVQAVYADGASTFIATTFTTLEAAPAPTGLAATKVTTTSATLKWEGVASEYNVRYSVVSHDDVLAEQNFDDSSLGSWTTIDANGDGFGWILATAAAGVYHQSGVDLTGYGHNGSTDFLISGSYGYYVGALTPDNYLVSPQVPLGGSISFWAQAQDNTYPEEHFGVAVSTTGNTNAADFTTIAEWTLENDGTNSNVPGPWRKFTVDLSAYSGMGYVAIRHFDCTDQFLLNIDDIVIEGPSDGAQWTELTVSGNSVDIGGLKPETEYAWEVQGNYGDDGLSTWRTATFTTRSFTDAPSDLDVTDITSTTATLNWVGSQDSYHVKYRHELSSVDPAEPATIILEAHNVWANGSGYQMLLDANATAYGTIIPASGALTQSGDASAETYAEFEYKIPGNADGSMTTQNIVIDGSVTIQIPAGTYDWCITNPSPNNRVWIAGSYGNVDGRYDDFVFEPGVTYHFTMKGYGSDDGATLEITRPMSDWITVDNVTSPYELTGLTPNTNYEWQVQGVLSGATTEWSVSSSFTTECAPYQVPYACGFEDKADLNCWTVISDQSLTGVHKGAGFGHTGANAFEFWQTTNPPQYLISPKLSGIRNSLHVEFYYRRGNSSNVETFHVGYSTTDNNPESFVWGDEINDATTTYQLFSADYPANTKYVAIKYTSNDKTSLLIDDFLFENVTACVQPTDLATTYVGDRTATLGWTGYNDSYHVEYRKPEPASVLLSEDFEYASFFEARWNVVNNSVNYIETNTGKIERRYRASRHGGDYSFRFSSCSYGDSFEEYIISKNALTGVTDETVMEFYYSWTEDEDYIQVGYSSTTNDIASFTFGEPFSSSGGWGQFHEAVPVGTKYVAIKYTAAERYQSNIYIDDIVIGNPADWQTADTNEATVTLTGLEPATIYDVRVQGDCGNGDVSPVSETITFTTLEYLPGDVNGDGGVTIADVLAVAEYIINDGYTTGNFNYQAANVDTSDYYITIADAVKILEIILKGGPNTNDPSSDDGHDYVDLGLPSGTLWATCNVGADTPESFGGYFAWGETVPSGQEDTSNTMNYAYAGNYTKTYYDWSTYKWCEGSNNKMTKYCTSSSYGYHISIDNKTVLDLEDDAAYVNWGQNWCMPTLTQWDELRTNCTWTWTTKDNVSGYEVTGTNGNSIFLPAAGYRFNKSYGGLLQGYYWSRTLNDGVSNKALYLNFLSSNVYLYSIERCNGLSVRPVRR